MKKSAMFMVLRSVAAILPVTLFVARAVAQEPGVRVLHDFGTTPTAGDFLNSPLVSDAAGNLYGVTNRGGTLGFGTAFELTKKPDGAWAQKTLHIFTGGRSGDGPPLGPLAIDASGNLYGTATADDGTAYGLVFELTPAADGTWTETVLHYFTGEPYDGAGPQNGVIFDSVGNLYGTTLRGGARFDDFYGGTVFKMTPQQGGGWNEEVIYSFYPNHNGAPNSGLTLDKFGNLYGSTLGGPGLGLRAGTIYKLERGRNDQWSYSTLHVFMGLDWNGNNLGGDDGAQPDSGVIVDDAGNLYGVATYGGKYNYGAVFEVPAGQDSNGPDKILYSFHSEDYGGEYPLGGLVFDPSGDLYGTTSGGGSYGGGKVFEMLPPPAGEDAWQIKALHDFGGFEYNGSPAIDGAYPAASMIFGTDGNLYGTTLTGGYHPEDPSSFGGTAFELTLH